MSNSKNSSKIRADQALVDRKIVDSRSKALSLILAKEVLKNDGIIVQKAGEKVSPEDHLYLRSKETSYVSRSALKLKGALDEFKIDVKDQKAMDVGSSTGGFTEVLLERGVTRVHAVDVGTNQLHFKLRTDNRVIVHEQTNARSMNFDTIGEKVNLIVGDVSFISLLKLLENLKQFAEVNCTWVMLVKPQFEAAPEQVGKGGVIRDENIRTQILEKFKTELKKYGFRLRGQIDSTILGKDGNKECIMYWVCA